MDSIDNCGKFNSNILGIDLCTLAAINIQWILPGIGSHITVIHVPMAESSALMILDDSVMPVFQLTSYCLTSSKNTIYVASSLPLSESLSLSNHPYLGCRWTSLINNFNSSHDMLNCGLHHNYHCFIMASKCFIKHSHSWHQSSYTSKSIMASMSVSDAAWPVAPVSDCWKLHYNKIVSWVLNIDTRATSKTKVRPVSHCMQICEVVYKDILKRLTIKTLFENSIMQFVAV
jgi:hypothetical protein